MAPEVLYRVCYGTTQPEKWQTQSLTIRPAILHGYERHKVMDADYPGIVPAEPSPDSSYLASTVRGTLVTGLTEGDLWRLDIFEGVEYERQDVDVLPLDVVGDESGRGNVESTTPVRAQTYVFAESRDRLEPGEWDFGDFVRTKMVRWTGGNEEYEGKSSELRPSIRGEGDTRLPERC